MKTKPAPLLLVTVAMLMLVAACSKESLVDFDPNFIGTWHTQDSFGTPSGQYTENYMSIEGEEGSYGWLCSTECNGCNCDALESGKIWISKDGVTMNIGGMHKRKRPTLTINVFPHQNTQGKWECTLDGFVMVRE